MRRTAIPLNLECPISKLPCVAELDKENHYLGQLLSAMLASYPDPRCRFRTAQASAFVPVLYRSGAVDRIHGFEAFDDPMLFWDLLDAVRAEDPSEGRTLPLRGLWCLYQKVSFNHKFSDEFIHHPKSIYYLIGKERMLDLFSNHSITRDNYFAVALKSQFKYHGHPIILHFKSAYLRGRLYRSLKGRDIDNYFDNLAKTTSFVEAFEGFFSDPENIRSFEDFTPSRLMDCLSAIKNTYGICTIECRVATRLVLLVWGDLMHDFPDFDFFAESNLFTAETVLTEGTANFLSLGYQAVAVGREGELPAYEKVLFIVRRSNMRTSIRREYQQTAVDFTRIKDPVWRKAVVNYSFECLSRGNKSRFGVVIKHLEEFFNVRPTGDADHHFTTFDFRLMRNVVSGHQDVSPASKACKFNVVKNFMKWAANHGYITVEEGFWKTVKNIRIESHTAPSGLSVEEIEKLDAALVELGQVETRFLLDRCIMHIQLHSQVRNGQICSLLVSELKWNDDGTCDAWQLTKTSGRRIHDNYMSPQAAEWLRLAMDISRPLREACPAGSLKDSVFLYRNKRKHNKSNLYHTVTTTSFTDDLKEACEKAGIRVIRSGNIRDTGVTARKKLARLRGFTSLETGAFVGHACCMSTNAYHDLDFRDVLEELEGITIGTLDNV